MVISGGKDCRCIIALLHASIYLNGTGAEVRHRIDIEFKFVILSCRCRGEIYPGVLLPASRSVRARVVSGNLVCVSSTVDLRLLDLPTSRGTYV